MGEAKRQPGVVGNVYINWFSRCWSSPGGVRGRFGRSGRSSSWGCAVGSRGVMGREGDWASSCPTCLCVGRKAKRNCFAYATGFLRVLLRKNMEWQVRDEMEICRAQNLQV